MKNLYLKVNPSIQHIERKSTSASFGCGVFVTEQIGVSVGYVF